MSSVLTTFKPKHSQPFTLEQAMLLEVEILVTGEKSEPCNTAMLHNSKSLSLCDNHLPL